MGNPTLQILISALFLVANIAALRTILALNRRKTPKRSGEGEGEEAEAVYEGVSETGRLPASDILGWEFEYARTTASEAMQDRHTMINFYLLAVGVVVSGVIGSRGAGAALPEQTGTVLLWLICAIGWLYFLKIVRLRQAWYDSALAMNQIKDFYIRHAEVFEGQVLRQAFRWKKETLPEPDKAWTIYFYSAMLIALLNSVVYVAGGFLLSVKTLSEYPLAVGGIIALLGVAFFAFHIRMYFDLFR